MRQKAALAGAPRVPEQFRPCGRCRRRAASGRGACQGAQGASKFHDRRDRLSGASTSFGESRRGGRQVLNSTLHFRRFRGYS